MWIDAAGFQKSLAALPLRTCQAGETVLADGSRTDRLLILKTGNVAVVKEGVLLTQRRLQGKGGPAARSSGNLKFNAAITI